MTKRIGSPESQDSPGVGLGTEQRVQYMTIVGQALTLNGAIDDGSVSRRDRSTRSSKGKAVGFGGTAFRERPGPGPSSRNRSIQRAAINDRA